MLRIIASPELFCSAILDPFCHMILHILAEKCPLTFTLNVSRMLCHVTFEVFPAQTTC
jgi:hypothetical protein